MLRNAFKAFCNFFNSNQKTQQKPFEITQSAKDGTEILSSLFKHQSNSHTNTREEDEITPGQ